MTNRSKVVTPKLTCKRCGYPEADHMWRCCQCSRAIVRDSLITVLPAYMCHQSAMLWCPDYRGGFSP